ncbi:MAG: hypothetical protein KBT32_01050 [Bacteroidales bacterium]|nr:hypothetical protein [Candidatus Physcocola equi]
MAAYELGGLTSEKADVTGERNGHGYVDLGLPSGTLWATNNLGATKPEGYGSYYAWGEIKTKATYTIDNSIWYDVGLDELKSQGVINSSGNLTSGYDAATANWGAGWRMPTLDEIKELKSRCRWSWTTVNGVKGYKVTGPSGKSIFLPAAGAESYLVGSIGYYWGSTAYDFSYFAFDSDNYDWYGNSRGLGLSVRPVSE